MIIIEETAVIPFSHPWSSHEITQNWIWGCAIKRQHLTAWAMSWLKSNRW